MSNPGKVFYGYLISHHKSPHIWMHTAIEFFTIFFVGHNPIPAFPSGQGKVPKGMGICICSHHRHSILPVFVLPIMNLLKSNEMWRCIALQPVTFLPTAGRDFQETPAPARPPRPDRSPSRKSADPCEQPSPFPCGKSRPA